MLSASVRSSCPEAGARLAGGHLDSGQLLLDLALNRCVAAHRRRAGRFELSFQFAHPPPQSASLQLAGLLAVCQLLQLAGRQPELPDQPGGRAAGSQAGRAVGQAGLGKEEFQRQPQLLKHSGAALHTSSCKNPSTAVRHPGVTTSRACMSTLDRALYTCSVGGRLDGQGADAAADVQVPGSYRGEIDGLPAATQNYEYVFGHELNYDTPPTAEMGTASRFNQAPTSALPA